MLGPYLHLVLVATEAPSHSIVICVHGIFDSDDSGLIPQFAHQFSVFQGHGSELFGHFQEKELIFFQSTADQSKINQPHVKSRELKQGSGPENTIITDKLQTRMREIHGCSCQVTFLLLQINILPTLLEYSW